MAHLWSQIDSYTACFTDYYKCSEMIIFELFLTISILWVEFWGIWDSSKNLPEVNWNKKLEKI